MGSVYNKRVENIQIEMQHNNFIIEVLEEASQIAKASFGKVSSITKKEDNNQVLTETDLTIGTFILNRIKKEFPGYNVIDEEAGVIENHSSFTWVIDPIDGTSNFASGVPTYGIMMGLLKDGLPLAGGIALPYFDEIYTAEKGMGTFCNGKKVQVTSEEKLSSTLVAYGIDGHKENPELTKKEGKILTEILLTIRNLRASNSCFDVVMVAKGSYGAYLNQTQKIWDNVAEHILIEEAGGKVTDFYGKPLRYDNPTLASNNNYTFCAAPPLLHEALQGIIHML